MNRPTPAARLRRHVGIAAILLSLSLAAGHPSIAQEAVGTPEVPANTSGAYRLSVRDEIEVSIFDEPDLATRQRLDNSGRVNLPLVGTITLAGRTLREAEELVQQTYIDKRILRRPMATVRVLAYAPREVAVNGAVASPGMLTFPPEVRTLDIVEVLSRCGGMTSRANAKRVQLTRVGSDGAQVTTEINVEDLIEHGRGTPVEVLPGDTVFVPTRQLF